MSGEREDFDRLIDFQLEHAPAPEEDPPANGDGDPQCAAGCGYPVALAGDVCGECGCEDDGGLY